MGFLVCVNIVPQHICSFCKAVLLPLVKSPNRHLSAPNPSRSSTAAYQLPAQPD
ncbi:hypothetical protein Scep_006882 [Stephania cephalantha]|uniref:Uncharacterized protein n=1 Tax=Stephania cephalantha TaxID=152367 RepID=A0AAP0KBI4_9MAGN